MFPNKKMSSMYLHHIICFPTKILRIFSSKSVINKIAYGGTILVSMCGSTGLFKNFLNFFKNFLFSTISASSMRVSLGICLLSLNSKNLRREVRPSLFGMLG